MAKTLTIPAATPAVAAAVGEYFRLQDETKAAYKRIDELEGLILQALKATKRVGKLMAGQSVVSAKDNFGGRNVAFKTTAIRRWEITRA